MTLREGCCKYCGEVKMVEMPEAASQDIVDKEVTFQCTCFRATEVRKQKKTEGRLYRRHQRASRRTSQRNSGTLQTKHRCHPKPKDKENHGQHARQQNSAYVHDKGWHQSRARSKEKNRKIGLNAECEGKNV